MWYVEFTKQAAKDASKLKSAGLAIKTKQLVEVVRRDPFGRPPSYEALVGNLMGLYSRRINLQHRFVYMVTPGTFQKDSITYEGIVKVVRMWTYYNGVR
ncbi:Txe/YoeB family addiction module toxin [Atopobium sp. oral taxon 416]|uniref:Txe/YoeB family addiction module toxin n=1 Tax=Atopobium sp. oral taxon 416 TaxID=712157 RepID=UPI001BA99C59|nr:Txe/YoeB family addiction module toxin [Atopobium sp. oral taxon 416]QUC03181.1 Txe/YoeB family addiction module toxin [Atopobium sp. oral taxon 416]